MNNPAPKDTSIEANSQIRIQLFMNGTFRGYREVSARFLANLERSTRIGKLKKADIQWIIVMEDVK